MLALLLTVLVLCVLLLLIGLYQKSTNAKCKSNKRLDGKTTLVTGGTMGMGFEIATDFARRGAKVIIACPFEQEGMEARKSIIEKTGNNNVIFKLLDLASLKSVRELADDILRNEERLDLLINNAGVGVPGDFKTKDDFNFIMQVNYFGHFLLTLLLLPLLKKSGTPQEPSRIVNTSSFLHAIGRADMKHWNEVGYYWLPLFLYSNSKFCVIPFSRELTKRLRGASVVVNTVDPGAVGTGIFMSCGKFFGALTKTAIYYMFKTPWDGAQTAIYVALDQHAGIISGEFFKNCRLSRAIPSAYNEKIAINVWEESVRLVKLTDEELANCLKQPLQSKTR